MVQDAATGEVLFDRSGDAGRVPASNMKLLTAVAALRTLGPDRRFSTTVVAGADPRIGGADRRRRRAARRRRIRPGRGAGPRRARHAWPRRRSAALQDDGVTGPVTVLLDDSLFTGPALNPAWSPEDVAAGEVAPLFPLALNSARFDPAETTGPRPQDAAMTAAEAFSAQLAAAAAAAGLTVAPGVARVPAGSQRDGGTAGSGPGQGPGRGAVRHRRRSRWTCCCAPRTTTSPR